MVYKSLNGPDNYFNWQLVLFPTNAIGLPETVGDFLRMRLSLQGAVCIRLSAFVHCRRDSDRERELNLIKFRIHLCTFLRSAV